MMTMTGLSKGSGQFQVTRNRPLRGNLVIAVSYVIRPIGLYFSHMTKCFGYVIMCFSYVFMYSVICLCVSSRKHIII